MLSVKFFRKNSLLILGLAWFGSLHSQYTFKLSKEQARLFESTEKPDSTYIIFKDSLLYITGVSSQLHAAILYNPTLQKIVPLENCIYNFKFALTIDSCYFKSYDKFPIPDDCNDTPIKLNFKQGFTVSNSKFTKELSIRYVHYTARAGAANINSNESEAIYVDDTEFSLLNVMNNHVLKEINIAYTRAEASVIAFNNFKSNDGCISLSYSKFNVGCSVLENFPKKLIFDHDTIKGILNIQFTNNIGLKKFKPVVIEIKNSLINSQCVFISKTTLCSSKLIFENCSFGNSASLFNLAIDTIVFKNCSDIPYPLFLTADSSKKLICIQLINSNVNNIRFDYTDKFKLYFDSNISNETKNNTYQSLLAKYKSEGKPENIEKIDVEYKRYEYQKNWLMYPLWLLDYLWWRYGYSKWLVIVWTLVFLSLFFRYNYINWEGMRKIYGVFDKDDLSMLGQGHNTNRIRKKLVYVLLYTSFIFFSLRIDFDKLKYSNNKYLTSFFIQYIVGLICLFFFANAIFKLN